MTRRPTVPPLPNKRPSDVLFQGPTAPVKPPEQNRQVTLYLPPSLLADIDDYRGALFRERGVRVDRSRVMRDLIRGHLDGPEILKRLLKEEET